MSQTTSTVNVEIKAGVQGKESVEALTARIDEMAKVLEGDLKRQAQEAAQKLRELGEQQAAINAFEQLKREAVAAAHALKLAEKEAADFQAQISTAGPPTAQEAAGLHKLQQAADAARTAMQQQSAALAGATAELSRHGIAATNTRAAQQRLAAEVDQVRESVQNLGGAYPTTASRAAAAAEGMNRSHRAIGEGVNSISEQLHRVQSAYLALQSGSALVGMLKDAAETADAYNTLAARIKLTTGEGKAFETALAGVQQVAVATRSDLAATAELFTKLSEAGKTLGVGQREALALTQTINQAIQLSGGGAEAAKASITQLVQGLQSGVLRGDEFNSVMEQSPRLAKALADGLGVSTGKLRELAEAGRLTSDTVIKSLQGQSDAVAKEFAKLPPTVGGALQNLSTAWTVYVGQVDKASGASQSAAQAIGFLSDNLSTIAGYLIDAGKAAAGLVAVRLAQGFLAAGQAAKAAAADVALNTVATTANTAAQVANNAAQMATAGVSRLAADQLYKVGAAKADVTAKAGLMAGAVGVASAALGVAGAAARGALTLVGGLPGVLLQVALNAKDLGTWLGEGAAKLVIWAQGGKNVEQQAIAMAEAEKKLKEQVEALADARKKQQAADEAAALARFGLSDAAKKLIGDFDDLIKKGESADAAIAKIGKDFDLGSLPGIKAAGGVLDKLAADGKISAEQVQAAWAEALDGKDLAKFEVMARQSFGQAADDAAAALNGALRKGFSGDALKPFEEAVREAMKGAQGSAEQLASALDNRLREAVKRTGLDFASISGGMSKASISALNDVETIINGFSKLKAAGADATAALTASIGQAIDTADSQKAIDAVKTRIESLRKLLGDTITNGLLDEARDKAIELKNRLDDLQPGITSVDEAMRRLGLATVTSLKNAATEAVQAYGIIQRAGQQEGESYEGWQNRKAAAAKVMIERMIAANGGVVSEAIKARAAIEGVGIAGDGAGKAIVQGFTEGRQAVMSLTGAIEDQITVLERENAAIERANAAREKALALERQRLNVDKDGFTLDKQGGRLTASAPSQRSVFDQAKSQGVDDATALQIAQRFVDDRGFAQNWAGFQSVALAIQDAINKAILEQAQAATQSVKSTTATTSASSTPATEVNFNLSLNGVRYGTVATDKSGAESMQSFLSALQQAKGTAA